MIDKIINIYVATCLSRGIVENCKAGTHEETGIVETHLERQTYLVPLMAVGGILERGHVPVQAKVAVNAQEQSPHPSQVDTLYLVYVYTANGMERFIDEIDHLCLLCQSILASIALHD